LLIRASFFFVIGCIALLVVLAASAIVLKPNVFFPLAVTVLTAFLGLAATLHTQRETRRREIEAAYRKDKVEAYLAFLKLIERLLAQTKSDLGLEKMPEKELIEAMMDIRTRAILWGSPGVLKGLSNLTKMEMLGISPFDVLEELQREIRKDLGLSNEGLEQDFFAKLPLRDPDDLERVREQIRTQ